VVLGVWDSDCDWDCVWPEGVGEGVGFCTSASALPLPLGAAALASSVASSIWEEALVGLHFRRVYVCVSVYVYVGVSTPGLITVGEKRKEDKTKREKQLSKYRTFVCRLA
jgi:hypothetical protein